MATGMKHWLGLVAGGFAIVAVATLPPSTTEIYRTTSLPEQRRYDAVRTEVRRAHGVLRETRWSDSLSALAVRTAVDGLAFGFPESDRLTTEGVEEWKALLSAQVEAIEPRDGQMVVGFFAQPVVHGTIPDVPTPSVYGRHTFVGVRDGTPYCLQVNALFRIRDVDLRSGASLGLAGCRLYAKYGAAGPRIQDWLDAGALGFALRSGDDRPFAEFELDVPIFGLSRGIYASTLELQRCLSGDTGACVRVVTDPEIIFARGGDVAYLVANSPVSNLDGFSRSPFEYQDDYLLADLEAELGAEAFARFWTSDASVPQAFEAAFGVEMGAWVLTWVESEIGLYQAGPTTRAGAFWLSVLTLMVLASIASGTAMRRRVG